jgi:hypothetical protein
MLTTGNTQQLTRKKVIAKKVKKNKKIAPKGSHYMPDGSLMKDSAMKPSKKKGKSNASY